MVRESPAEAAETGRAMARGRTLSQFQEEFPDEASCAVFLLERRWSTTLFARDVARNGRRRSRVALTPTSASIVVGKRQSFQGR